MMMVFVAKFVRTVHLIYLRYHLNVYILRAIA